MFQLYLLSIFYLLKVGNGEIDHASWSRPEDMGDMQRPSYKIDCQNPGSDLAASTAASLLQPQSCSKEKMTITL
jgi:hypothetical protein